MRERLKLFFAQLFLLISSVFKEQSQICVKSANPSMLEQGDLFWQDNATHCLCQVWWRHTYFWLMILRKKIYTKNEWTSYHNKIVWLSFVLMQDSWQRLMSDSTSWQRDTDEFLQFTEPVACREHTLPWDEKLSEPKGWIRGNTKIGPVLEWKSQPVTYKVNKEWNLEMNL